MIIDHHYWYLGSRIKTNKGSLIAKYLGIPWLSFNDICTRISPVGGWAPLLPGFLLQTVWVVLLKVLNINVDLWPYSCNLSLCVTFNLCGFKEVEKWVGMRQQLWEGGEAVRHEDPIFVLRSFHSIYCRLALSGGGLFRLSSFLEYFITFKRIWWEYCKSLSSSISGS